MTEVALGHCCDEQGATALILGSHRPRLATRRPELSNLRLRRLPSLEAVGPDVPDGGACCLPARLVSGGGRPGFGCLNNGQRLPEGGGFPDERGRMGRKWWLRGVAPIVVALAAFAANAAMASSHAAGLTIKAADKGATYVINKSVTDKMYFAPGTASVKSGATLTFEYDGKAASEPHTITIVSVKDLPKTAAQINNCTICNKTAAGHLKNPKAPPGPTNDIANWVVDKGQTGFDGPGDSIAIEGAKHRSISIKVTAPAGTILHFICAVHPWMQGTLRVT